MRSSRLHAHDLCMSDKPTVVLVHGAWGDGSSWSDVIRSLQASGFTVTAPQFPETSVAADVARLRQVLRRQTGPTVVAGHSYGGQIMTALGPDAPNVVALVYIAAFGLDKGESLGGLLSGGPPTPALAHLIVDEQAFAWLPEEDFITHFASDVERSRAKVMWAVQQGLSMSTFEDVMGVPAWKSHPSWYLVSTDDKAIPPEQTENRSELGSIRVTTDGHLEYQVPYIPASSVLEPGKGAQR